MGAEECSKFTQSSGFILIQKTAGKGAAGIFPLGVLAMSQAREERPWRPPGSGTKERGEAGGESSGLRPQHPLRWPFKDRSCLAGCIGKRE